MPRTKNTPLTSAELLKQSEALRRQAEELKRKEIPEVVARMKEAIAHYGLTAADLGLAASVAKAARPAKKQGKAEAPAAAVPKKAAKKPATIKYRDGAGHTWSGYGPKPKWLKDALAAGASDESLRA
ncbi:MAG: H-NS histone family protein [Burkholderiales bacterium]|nr:H-NS histone family protein [Burkholderiales bacterium]